MIHVVLEVSIVLELDKTVPDKTDPRGFGGKVLTDEKSPIDSIKHFFNVTHQSNCCPFICLPVPMWTL